MSVLFCTIFGVCFHQYSVYTQSNSNSPDPAFSLAVSERPPVLPRFAGGSSLAHASSEAKRAAKRLRLGGFGSGTSWSSTPCSACSRALRYRHRTPPAAKSMARTAAAATIPSSAGLAGGAGLGEEPACRGRGVSAPLLSGGSSAGGGETGGGEGGGTNSQPGHSQASVSTQLQLPPWQLSGLHMAYCLPTRLWQPHCPPRQHFDSRQAL